jgi:hypothetical protein
MSVNFLDPRLPDRFWNKVIPEPNSGCWLWIASLDTHGYGQIHYAGTTVKAYRLAYEVLVGPIPDGLEPDHTCRTRPCCNPDHLEPVTRRVNQLRGDGFAGVNARKTHCPKRHPYNTDNTRLRGTWRDCKICKHAWDDAGYQRHREARLKKAAAYRAANRESLRQKERDRRAKAGA